MTKKKCKVTIDPEFKAKLVKLGVYRRFMENTVNSWTEDGFETYKVKTIPASFYFDQTPEGEEFWHNIHDRLNKLL